MLRFCFILDLKISSFKSYIMINVLSKFYFSDILYFLPLFSHSGSLCTGYYRNFIPNYTAVAPLLSDLTKKGLPTEVEWSDPHEKAYGTLKRMTVTKPVFRLPEISKPFVLRTDASNTVIRLVQCYCKIMMVNYFLLVMQARSC